MKRGREGGSSVTRQLLMWIGTILISSIGIPSLIVLAGGFYSPALLQSIQTQSIGTIEGTSVEDYREEEVIQTLAKVIPPESSLEAIKAQAVIVRTYMLRRELGMVEENGLGKLTKKEMQDLWKEDYEETYETYQNAAYSTKGEVIFCNEELIEPVYHKESAGQTRDAKSLYKIEVPYLKSVSSPYDKISSEKRLTKEAVVSELEKAYPELVVEASYIENQIQIVSRDEGGYIESLQIGNVLINGEDFRKIFDLPSAAVSIEADGDQMIFHTLGIGHGVGLSQNGANQMALEGKNYKEIIEYYFTGVTIHK